MDDEQQTQPEEQEQPEEQGQAQSRPAEKKKSSIIHWVIAGVILIILIFFGFAIGMGAFGLLKMGEPAPVYSTDSGQTVECSGTKIAGLTGERYEWVKDASQKYLGGDEGVLISLIFKESGWNSNAKNNSSSAAGLGQFMNGTAESFPEFKGKKDDFGINWEPAPLLQDLPKTSFNTLTSIQKTDPRFDPKRSIYAAAHYIGDLSKKDKFSGKDLFYVYGYGYNTAGAAPANDLKRIYDGFVSKGGCRLVGPSSSTIKTIAAFDTSYMKKAPVKDWADGRPTFVPTGITLHWTAGSDVDSAINAMNANKTYVHLIIDKQGNVFQLLPLNIKQSGSGFGIENGINANSFTIGIEIVGLGESDLMNNNVQKQKVVETVKTLIREIPTIENRRGNEINYRAKRGIFGHFQTAGGSNFYPGCHSTRKIDPGVNYLKYIWDQVGSIGNGCTGINNGAPVCYPGGECS